MIYFYIDGDDVGLRIERSLLSNDEGALSQINVEVTSTIQRLTEALERQGFEIVFSGADGVIGKSPTDSVDAIHRCVCSLDATLTFSIGVGRSLRDAFASLRFAKANGKNGLVTFDTCFHWQSSSEVAERGGTIRSA